jgi:isopropylmalate/homocitrate/citramalate synthase
MILGKHTGKAAIVEKLKERGVTLPDETLTELLRRVKAASESRTKEDLRAFLAEYRTFYERPGLTDAEFWALVDGLRAAPPRAA